jgi:hypothetical protein
MTRERQWQLSYVVACVFQLIIEVFVFESVECVWIHYSIPSLVAEEVEATLVRIHDTIDEAFSDEVQVEPLVDFPSYFFVSTNLAEIFPQSFESTVVSTYLSSYPSPGGYVHQFPKAKRVDNPLNLRENRTWGLLKRIGVASFLTAVFQQIGTFHIRAQKLFIHVLQPIFLAFIFVAWKSIAASLLLTILSCMALIFLCTILIRWLLSKRGSRTRSPNQRAGGSSQPGKYNSVRSATSEALNRPSFSGSASTGDGEKKDEERSDGKLSIMRSDPLNEEKSDEEKDPSISDGLESVSLDGPESLHSSSFDSYCKKDVESSSQELSSLEAFNKVSSFDEEDEDEDEDAVQDAYDISDSSDDLL